jgi:hypothetical protein
MDWVNGNPCSTDHYYNYYYSQIPQEDGQHTSQPETGQPSAGVAASGALGNYPVPIPSSPEPGLEYLLRSPQAITLAEVIQNEVPPNSQPAVEKRCRKARKGQPTAKERFLAGLEAYARGALLKDCSTTLPFRNYVTDDGYLRKAGKDLRVGLQPTDQVRVDQALHRRREMYGEPSTEELPNPQPAVEAGRRKARARGLPPIKERFLAGLEAFARGAALKDCSSSLRFGDYITTDGTLVGRGLLLKDQLTSAEKTLLDQAIIARQGAKLHRLAENDTVQERFLAGLDNYARGVQLVNCSTTLAFKDYVSDKGTLNFRGQVLRASLSPDDQNRVDQALLSRNRTQPEHLRDNDKVKVQERFLAGLDKYAQGLELEECSATLKFRYYLSDNCSLQKAGQTLYDSLSPENQRRVNRSLAARRRVIAQQLIDILEPYANGPTLQVRGNQSGLKSRANTYLTSKGGLTSKGERLIENLPPGQRNEVLEAIARRQRHTELNPQVSEPWRQWPGMLPPMPETGGMAPTAMADPTQAEAMRTEAMWATTWQLTGQAVPGPSESVMLIPRMQGG